MNANTNTITNIITLNNAKWLIVGTSDEPAQCDVCSKYHLKGAITLLAYDASNDVTTMHIGVTCAYKLSGVDMRQIQAIADSADRAAYQARKIAWRNWSSAQAAFMNATVNAAIDPTAFDDSEQYCERVSEYMASDTFRALHAEWLESNPAIDRP
jgi:hypothetical protein